MLYPNGLRAKAEEIAKLEPTGPNPFKTYRLCGQGFSPPGWPGLHVLECCGERTGTVFWRGLEALFMHVPRLDLIEAGVRASEEAEADRRSTSGTTRRLPDG
jgi:hypothetical protein